MHNAWRFGLLVAVACAGCSAPADDFGPVPAFTLTERNGQTITRADFQGKVCIVGCVFTRCTGACPQITGVMARLQHELRDQPDVLLVSLSVDPDHDTPAVLRDYADRQGAKPDRWLFLTGPKADVYELIEKGFRLKVLERQGAERTPGNEVDHSNRLVLVDRQGRQRGYFDATDSQKVEELLKIVPALSRDLFFPTLNAALNGAAGVLLVLGYLAIRRRQITLHKACMLVALAVSALFLACYLYYHIIVRGGEPTRFVGPPAARTVYLAILLSHTILAVLVAPLALVITYLGLRDRLERHVRLARWTLPVWLYVSATGGVVYALLYHVYAPP
jgi:protein SCO1/2/putative membrane protein